MQSPSLIKLMWFPTSVLLFCMLIPSLCAQTSDAQAIESKSWTTITESHTSDTNPTRTTESHRQSGKGTVDSQSVERLGVDGHYEPYFDIEKESVQVNDTTIRTVERRFDRDGSSGQKILTQVTEEEKQSLPTGDEKVVRTTSNPDPDDHLRVVKREVADTKKISPDVQEKKTTVFVSDGRGGMAPSIQIEQREKRSGDHTVEVQKSTLLLDGAGNWQVNERKESTVKEDGKERTTEERIFRPGADDKLALVSRTLGKESETAAEMRNTVETYSTDILGSAPDGNLHLSQRVTMVKRARSDGAQATEQQVEQPNPGDPGAGLQVTTKTLDVVQPDTSGTRETRTIEVRDASGSFTVVSFDTRKSDKVHATDLDIAPQNKPK
jgi:hypothetical protein